MKFLRLAMRNAEVDRTSWQKLYEREVERKIREKYTIGQELAIIRQKDEKTEEFDEYYSYVELCKQKTKKELGI